MYGKIYILMLRKLGQGIYQRHLVNIFFIKAYVDGNHAVNMANRRSHSGIIVYVNNAPTNWCSKLQNTVEASCFGLEFIALRIVTDIIESLRCNLRCFVIPVEGPAEVFCDNMAVVNNSSIPTSSLNKRLNVIY